MFIIAIISTAITYTAFSMNQITDLAQTIEIKQISDLQKTTEKYEIVSIRTDSNQFNMTVVNTGDLPVHLTRLWVENTTDSSWPIAKYELDIAIPTGGSVDDIGMNLGLTALDTQSYMMILVTERGNTQKMFVNGIGAQSTSVYLNLRATPTIVPTGFTSTLILEVINTGTNQLLNVQPAPMGTSHQCIICNADPVSGPTPTSFDSLNPGDIATFEWVYKMTGDTGDFVTFTASLLNGLVTEEAIVTLKAPESAENAEVSLESGGVAGESVIGSDVLLFHMEQDLVPTPGYQMMSSSIDGGSGLVIDMETKEADDPLSFFTNNGTLNINIPAGDWVTSLVLRSEEVPTDVNSNFDMIFHFEDGQGVNPDNSEGDGNRDLEECGISQFRERISRTNDDAEEESNGVVERGPGGSTDHELVYDGNFQHIGLRWSLDVPQGASIVSADIRFRSDEDQTSGSPDIIIGAEFTLNAPEFAETNYDISDRWGSVTSNTVVWDSISGWGSGEEGPDTTTPDLKDIVQEIVDQGSWVSGNNIVFIFKDNSGGGDNDRRTAEHYDAGGPAQAARLTVNHGATGSPLWQAGEGPHSSGVYKYDGISQCHRSQNNISNSTGNDIADSDNTTSLWFRTDGSVSSEQMLVYWNGAGTHPNSDYYKISIGEGGTGKLLFEFSLSGSQTEITTCRSLNEYDDGNWYNVIVSRDQSDDSCTMYITFVNGTDTELPRTHNPSYSSSSVDADGKWYVATREETDMYFKGWIDDIMHWNDDMLDSTEAEYLSLTNYGSRAHEFDIYINKLDTSGNFLNNIFNVTDIPIVFQDSKGQSESTVGAYTMFNVTMTMPQVNFTVGQRMNFSMNFVPSTSIWEALELDMKIDDIGFIPYSSFLQMQQPSTPFPSYIKYSVDDEMELFVNNSGNDGIYLVYPGTRLSFFSETLGSYASFIKSVNGTDPEFELDLGKDSVYIPAAESAQLFFYKEPTDHPCNDDGNLCEDPDLLIMPPGLYSMSAWVNGYSDQGESFGRTIHLGTVTVTS